MNLKWATGYNNTGGLADFPVPEDREPYCPGVKDGRRETGGDGMVYQDGYQDSSLRIGFMTAAELNITLTALGLLTARSVKSTMKLPLEVNRTYVNVNCVLVRPDTPDEAEYIRGKFTQITFQIQRIRAI